jgi:hypothetical protein
VLVALAVTATAAAASGYETSSRPLSPGLKAQLRHKGFWHKGCPVALSGLRLLKVSYWGFDGRRHNGHLIVNAAATAPLKRAFRKLYGLHFPIRHLDIESVYGRGVTDGDPSGSFQCREAVPSPCTGGTGTGTWSMHAYGLAVDINPRENPYVGCGQSRDRAARLYRDRSRHRKGMVTPKAINAFTRSAGAGAAAGRATPRTTCTSRRPGTDARRCRRSALGPLVHRRVGVHELAVAHGHLA